MYKLNLTKGMKERDFYIVLLCEEQAFKDETLFESYTHWIYM